MKHCFEHDDIVLPKHPLQAEACCQASLAQRIARQRVSEMATARRQRETGPLRGFHRRMGPGLAAQSSTKLAPISRKAPSEADTWYLGVSNVR